MEQESKGREPNSSASTVERGREGEQRAVAFFVARGYRVLERNFRFRRCEIDLIVERDGVVAFVEVKSRRRSWGDADWGGPGPGRSPVSGAQQARLVKAADAYLRSRKGRPPEVRFDLVVVKGEGARASVNHLPSAFLPILGGCRAPRPPWHRLSLPPA